MYFSLVCVCCYFYIYLKFFPVAWLRMNQTTLKTKFVMQTRTVK